jgi:hypothetical protein
MQQILRLTRDFFLFQTDSQLGDIGTRHLLFSATLDHSGDFFAKRF